MNPPAIWRTEGLHMGVLTREERRTLITALLHLPNIDDPLQRRRLLADLPPALQESITFSNRPDAHITCIIDEVTSPTWSRLIDGSWPVLTVLENALDMVPGSSLVTELRGLTDNLQVRLAQDTEATATSARPPPAAITSAVSDRTTTRPRPVGLVKPLLLGGAIILVLLLGLDLVTLVGGTPVIMPVITPSLAPASPTLSPPVIETIVTPSLAPMFPTLPPLALQDSFEYQQSLTISPPWATEGTGSKGIDIGLGFSHSGKNNAWIRTADAGWNAISRVIRLRPHTTYAVVAQASTSWNVEDGRMGLRVSADHVLREVTFGPIPEYGPVAVNVQTSDQLDVEFFIGYFSPGEDSWLRVDDVVISVP